MSSQEEEKVADLRNNAEAMHDIESANFAAAHISTSDIKPNPPAPKRRNVNRQKSTSNTRGTKSVAEPIDAVSHQPVQHDTLTIDRR